jgi:hypothetical protein
MALSPNYGWTEPDNTGLVKNGAQDMRTLGDAIDTSVWNVGFGQAGKNKIINGDFGIWQRGTSFTNPNGVYLADRWTCGVDVAIPTWTISRQTFTPGTAPVAGYESQYFLRAAVTAIGTSTAQYLLQKIEDVRTFAGQNVTVSFWAKFDTTRNIALEYQQIFGSGGSTTVTGAISASVSVTNTWTRYSVTFTLPSVSGKTIGTGSSLSIAVKTPAANYTLDLWGFQLERGSKATPFQTASGGSPQAELAMCQRYYWRSTAGSNFQSFGVGSATSSTQSYAHVVNPVTMRVAPTSVDFSTLAVLNAVGSQQAVSGLALSFAGSFSSMVQATVGASLVAGNGALLVANNSTSAFIGFSAEL